MLYKQEVQSQVFPPWFVLSGPHLQPINLDLASGDKEEVLFLLMGSVADLRKTTDQQFVTWFCKLECHKFDPLPPRSLR